MRHDEDADDLGTLEPMSRPSVGWRRKVSAAVPHRRHISERHFAPPLHPPADDAEAVERRTHLLERLVIASASFRDMLGQGVPRDDVRRVSLWGWCGYLKRELAALDGWARDRGDRPAAMDGEGPRSLALLVGRLCRPGADITDAELATIERLRAALR